MASLSGSTTSTSVTMFTCPACKRDVTAQVVFTISSDSLSALDGEVTLKGNATGLHISHDCTPRPTRSALPPLTGDSHG